MPRLRKSARDQHCSGDEEAQMEITNGKSRVLPKKVNENVNSYTLDKDLSSMQTGF